MPHAVIPKKDKIIKFAGCYHGHSDAMLVKAGSGVMTAGIPDSAGVPAGCAQDTLTAIYNNIDSVRELFEAHPNEIARCYHRTCCGKYGRCMSAR